MKQVAAALSAVGERHSIAFGLADMDAGDASTT